MRGCFVDCGIRETEITFNLSRSKALKGLRKTDICTFTTARHRANSVCGEGASDKLQKLMDPVARLVYPTNMLAITL